MRYCDLWPSPGQEAKIYFDCAVWFVYFGPVPVYSAIRSRWSLFGSSGPLTIVAVTGTSPYNTITPPQVERHRLLPTRRDPGDSRRPPPAAAASSGSQLHRDEPSGGENGLRPLPADSRAPLALASTYAVVRC
jgi:hypothetical protein